MEAYNDYELVDNDDKEAIDFIEIVMVDDLFIKEAV